MTYGPISVTGDTSGSDFSPVPVTVTGLVGHPLPSTLTTGFLKYDSTLTGWILASSSATVTAGDVEFTPYGDISSTNVQSAIQELDDEKAAVGQTFYIGTTQVAINRASGSLTLYGVTVDNSINSNITNDTTTNATMYPVWVTANSGDLPLKVSSSKLYFNPSTGELDSTYFKSSGNSTFNSVVIGIPVTSPSGNMGIGDDPLPSNVSGVNNLLVGFGSLTALTQGTNNTAIGHSTLASNTTGTHNVAVGYGAIESATLGSSCVAVGFEALKTGSGSSNVGVGYRAAASCSSSGVTATGTYAANSCSADYTSAFGYYSLTHVTGAGNTAFGAYTAGGTYTTSGTSNTLLGYRSGYLLRAGNKNTLLGYQVASNIVDSSSNTVIGTQSLSDLSVILPISAFADYSSGRVLVSCNTATLLTGDSVTITGTTNYNGTYTITIVAADSFHITHSWSGTETGFVNRTGKTGSGNTVIGSETGWGITAGSGNTIIGAEVQSLNRDLTNNIILASGGTIRSQFDGTSWVFSGGITGTDIVNCDIDGNPTLNIGTKTTTQTINFGTASATQTINIGTGSGTTTINIGGSGDTVYIAGTLTSVMTTELEVTDKKVILNNGGASSSGGNSGIAIEENGTLTGSILVSTDRQSWTFIAPASSGSISLSPYSGSYNTKLVSSATADRVITMPDNTGTMVLKNNTIPMDTTFEILRTRMASDDLFRIAVGGSDDAGWVEIATADNGTEPIYVRQYTGAVEFTTIVKELTLLDGSGNTKIPGRLNIDDTTDATTTTDGSLQTDGGLSVVKKSYLGDTTTIVVNSTATSGNVFGLNSTINFNPSDTSTAATYPIYGVLTVTGSKNISVAEVLNSTFVHDGTGTISVAKGGVSGINNYSTGIISDARAYSITSAVNSGGGSITVNTGLHIESQTVGATNYAIKTNAGLVKIGDDTNATTTTDGSIQTAGGISVVKDVVVGGKVTTGSMGLTNGAFASATLTTSATTPDQTLDSFAIATYRCAKYVISVSSGSAYEITEITVIHDGVNTYINEYGTILTGAALATFSATISGGNLLLTTTPVNAVTTYKVVRTSINV